MTRRYVTINDLCVGQTYQHFKNRRFIVRVVDRFETSRGTHLILEHAAVKELQVCLTKTYELSKWELME